MSLSFGDAIEWLKKKANNINQKEGYRGVMGPISRIDDMNASDIDFADTTTLNNNLAQGIATYNTKYNALSSATHDYLGMTARYGDNKNFNVFVNTPMDFGSITASAGYTGGGGCISNNTTASSGSPYQALAGLTDASTQGFDTVYPPARFPNTPAGTALAMKACKLWAADSQTYSSSSTNPNKTYFALTRDTTANKFKCFTGNVLNNDKPTPYMVKQLAYKVASSNNATRGGLFMDGTIGVYNHNIPTTGADTANPYNIQSPFLSPLTKYIKCDKWIGGAINPNTLSATLGLNCSNANGTPVNMRYIYVKASATSPNLYPFIQIAQLAVLAFVNGAGKNVSSVLNNNKAVATSGNGSNYTNVTNASWNNNNSPPQLAIDGNLSARPHPSMYHSPMNSTKDEWWSVDLGQEFSVYEIIFYNRKDCCSDRAIGMTMQFKDAAGNFVTVKDPVSGNATQTITISSAALEQKFSISKP